MQKNNEYKGSRWQFTRDRSNWHFDPFRPPELGIDSYSPVGRFIADFAPIIEKYKKQVESITWATGVRKQYPANDPLKNALAEQLDHKQAGFDPDQIMFDRAFGDDEPLFKKMSAIIGMENNDIRFNLQQTGHLLVTHMDYLDGFERDGNPGRRFAVMLEDWRWGQIFQLGNANWTQWKAGDCITWEYRDIPHSTCNMGWWPRPMLQISGTVTEKTQKFLLENNSDRIIQVDL
jgi:hypothetical protein